MNKILRFFAPLTLLLFFFNSCVNTDIEEPPYVKDYPVFHANFSIKDLRALHTNGQFEKITEDKIIKAVVVADDRTGNYYKTLVVQDSTGGMEVKINATNLFNTFPVGRRIYIKLNGLTIGDYNGNFQLGGDVYKDDSNRDRIGNIEEPEIDKYIAKGEFNVPITPTVKTITELGDADINTLIQLNGIEVAESDLGQTYSDAVNKVNTNRSLKDCSNKVIIMRTSGYASFAGNVMPQGNGTITAIYTVFGTDKQLFLRDTADVKFDGKRCGEGGTGGDPINISDVRALYNGSTLSLPANKKIKGIVISDKSFSNITAKNVVIEQQGNGGIVIRFTENNTLKLGDEVEVAVGGFELSEFNGLLQINNVTLANAKVLSSGKTISPAVVTLKEFTTNFEKYESTLVKINGVSFSKSGSSTFAGNVDMTDATGSGVMYTTSYATFANDDFPSSAASVTGIGGQFNTPQVNIRSKADIQ